MPTSPSFLSFANFSGRTVTILSGQHSGRACRELFGEPRTLAFRLLQCLDSLRHNYNQSALATVHLLGRKRGDAAAQAGATSLTSTHFGLNGRRIPS
jgi:hypothetical protein